MSPGVSLSVRVLAIKEGTSVYFLVILWSIIEMKRVFRLSSMPLEKRSALTQL